MAFAVGMLARAMGKPTPQLYSAALRVLYYLDHHKHVGLRFQPNAAPMPGMSDVKHSTLGARAYLEQRFPLHVGCCLMECVENLQIVVPFVATADNMADFFIKPLGPKQFFPLRNRIMNFDTRDTAPAAVAATGGHDLDNLAASFDTCCIPRPA